MSSQVFLYDTTLRDGAQRQGISFSVADKLRITQLLADFGVDYIEGGWPSSNPKDAEYFRRVQELNLARSKICAFGSTRRVDRKAENDAQIIGLLEANTPVVTLVGKSSVLHVEQILRTSKEENLRLIEDSIRFFKSEGREVILDAEHFFDGFLHDPEYALACVQAADEAGADWIVLCDTNGGSLPSQISDITRRVSERVTAALGIHAHNDCELAVANSLAAVEGGARQIQGTINGIGERCGNANLISVLPNLVLKQAYDANSKTFLAELTNVSRRVGEIANLTQNQFAAYVGQAAFAHKGGLHAAAVQRLTASYEHIDPACVGNGREILVSELSGRGNIRLRAEQVGLDIGDAETAITEEIKKAEANGLALEAADGSFELIVRRHAQHYQSPFSIRDLMVQSIRRTGETQKSLATAKVQVDGAETLTAAEASGPVAAIDQALRQALKPFYPVLEDVRLTDYKVRILDPESATSATTRVWLEASMGEHTWCTVGCSENIIEASAQALLDSLELCILRLKERGAHYGRINAA